MRLEEQILTITRIEDSFDSSGCVFLKCKGYVQYQAVSPKSGKSFKAYNQFTSIRLYPVNEEQFIETKERLFSQQVQYPKIKIVAYDCDLTTNLMGGRICPILTVNKYDFEHNKLFNKRTLLKGVKNE